MINARKWIPFLVLGLVLFADQWLKIWIKTTMNYGEEVSILGLSWAKLHFVENPGMAFGWNFGGELGKYLLSGFRLVAIGFLIFLLARFIRVGESKGIIFAFSMLLAGAIGNMVDSAVYGLIFSESSYHGAAPASLFPPEGGYASFMQGKVVDMFYFPLIDTFFPKWVPFVGGQPFQFFQSVFNVADSAITIGVTWLLLFHRDFLSGKTEPTAKPETETSPDTDSATA